MPLRRTASLCAALAGALLSVPAAHAAPAGALDAAWSGDGLATAPFLATDGVSAATRVAHLPDGRVLAAGYEEDLLTGETRWALARFTATGALDPTFGKDGRVTVAMGQGRQPAGMALLADGKILVAGTARLPDRATDDFAAVRLLADGRVDQSYGSRGDGRTTVGVTGWTESLGGLAVDAQGRAYLAGSTAAPQGDSDVFVARLTAGGVPDATWAGGDGAHTDPVSGTLGEQVSAVALQGDRLLVAGRLLETDARAFLMRLVLPGGPTRDGDFGGAGLALIVEPGAPVEPRDVLSLPDGRVRLLAGVDAAPTVLGFTAGGQPDQGFGVGGRATGVPGTTAASARALLALPDGRLLSAGMAQLPDGRVAGYVQRHLAGGLPDASFGGDGVATLEAAGGVSGVTSLAPADGDYLAGGGQGPALQRWDMAVARVNASDEADPAAPGPTDGSPPPAPPATSQDGGGPSPEPPLKATALIALPRAGACVRGRRLRLRLTPGPGLAIRRASYAIGAGPARPLGAAARRGKPVRLAGLPAGAVRITVAVTLRDGRTLRLSRRLRACR